MKIGFSFTLLLLCGISFGQQTAMSQWPDEKITQMSASYMLQVAYNERGYIGVRVDMAHKDGKDVYAVVPGPLYHVRELRVSGLSDADVRAILPGAPKAGDVYSAARMNDWIKDARKELPTIAGNLMWKVEVDHEHAQVTLKVTTMKPGEERPQFP